MRYIYYLSGNSEDEQRKGIKEYLSLRGIYPGDCTTLQSDYSYEESEYDQGIRNLISGLKDNDTLYVWDFSSLGKSLESLYTNLLLGTNEGVSIVQCLDGTVASNDSPETIAIVNAIGIASRIELKISKIQRRQKYAAPQENKLAASGIKSISVPADSYDPDKIIVRRYTDKSIIVCGDSREYKEGIKAIGAIYNPRINNGRGAWIVSLKKLHLLQEALAGANYVVMQDCYISKADYQAKQGDTKRESVSKRGGVEITMKSKASFSQNNRTLTKGSNKTGGIRRRDWMSSIGFHWALEQLQDGKSRKSIVAEFNKRHATNPEDYSTSTGKPLTEAILSLWSKHIK